MVLELGNAMAAPSILSPLEGPQCSLNDVLLKVVFSPFSISFFRISVLFRVSVMSLTTVVSGLDQGFALPVSEGLVYAPRH